jgi:hypothetical protein
MTPRLKTKGRKGEEKLYQVFRMDIYLYLYATEHFLRKKKPQRDPPAQRKPLHV